MPRENQRPATAALGGCARRSGGQQRHPAGIDGVIVDAIRHCLAQFLDARFLDQEVMQANLFGFALRASLPPALRDVADQFFLLRGHRDHRLLRGFRCRPPQSRVQQRQTCPRLHCPMQSGRPSASEARLRVSGAEITASVEMTHSVTK